MFLTDFVIFTEETLNGELHFLCSDIRNLKVTTPQGVVYL